MLRFLLTALLSVAVMLADSETANAQRPPVRPPAVASPPRTVTPPPAARPVTPPVPQVGRNSLMSNKPQTQYGIFKIDTHGQEKTTLYKTGISESQNRSGGTLKDPRPVLAAGREYSSRALTQLPALNNNPTLSEGGRYVFRTRNFTTIPSQPAGGPTARTLITNRERQTVTNAFTKNGVPPEGNIRPKPSLPPSGPKK